MPAKQGLRAGQEGEPGRSGEDAAGCRKEDAIRGLPAWTADLALEDAELMTEREDLDAESGFGVDTNDQDDEEEADDGVGEGAQHDPRASQRRQARGIAGSARGDGVGLTAQVHAEDPTWPDRPWYTTKRTPSFADALGTLRSETWSAILADPARDLDPPQIASTLISVLASAA